VLRNLQREIKNHVTSGQLPPLASKTQLHCMFLSPLLACQGWLAASWAICQPIKHACRLLLKSPLIG
jgi:hypothetical protein